MSSSSDGRGSADRQDREAGRGAEASCKADGVHSCRDTSLTFH